MTKETILTISGLHTNDGETGEPIEIITPAQYYLKNGKHYVMFDEVMEGVEGEIKSTLKLTKDRVELLRNGAAVTRMIFEENQEYQTVYQTPMGPLPLSLYTDRIFAKIGEEEITIEIDYSLKAEEAVLTESTIRLHVCPKELKQF